MPCSPGGAKVTEGSGAFSEGRAFQEDDANGFAHRAPEGGLLALVGFIGFALLVGASAWAAMAEGARVWYPSLIAPPGAAPNAAFGVVWAIVYVLMGVSAWRVWSVAPRPGAYVALRVWGWQLLVNAAWSPVFFGLHAVGVALVLALVLLVLVVATLIAFIRRDRIAALVFAAYPLWLAYVVWLNAGLWWLNGRPFP